MTYDDLKLHGRETYSEFLYYKGEEKNPYDVNEDPERFKWWNFEKDYYDNYKKSGEWKIFTDFLDHWIKEKAAPEIGHDLSKSNLWIKEYKENAPF
jgi:hypothetical protein